MGKLYYGNTLLIDGDNSGGIDNKITNCITEIPQDIKLELSDGTLTLKASSKLYYPDGLDSNNNPKFTTRITTEDYVANGQYGFDVTPHILCLNNAAYWVTPDLSIVFSGTTAPTGYQYMLWYDTVNNIVKWTADSGSTWIIHDCSLPFGIATYNGGSYENGFKQIDQVFNGFGYIGSTVFALPGVKGLIPNGRNEDGSLKNIEFMTSNIMTQTLSATAEFTLYLDSSTFGRSTSILYYPEQNKVIDTEGYHNDTCIVGNLTQSAATITQLKVKQPFHAVDYNDAIVKSDWIEVQSVPVDPDPDKFYYTVES